MSMKRENTHRVAEHRSARMRMHSRTCSSSLDHVDICIQDETKALGRAIVYILSPSPTFIISLLSLMSLCVSSYATAAPLTPLGLLAFAADEVALYTTKGADVDVDLGGSESEKQSLSYTAGHAHVTSHRIIWMKHAQTQANAAGLSAAQPIAMQIALDCIERVEVNVRQADT
jgi:hypothetical protein